jgi:DNA-binding response OmpR family regulator
MTGQILLVGGNDETSETLLSGGFALSRLSLAAVHRAPVDDYQVVVVEDSGEPGSGTEVRRSLRLRSAVPIVIIARPGGDLVQGLELGADDYVTTPFSHAELVSRIRAILRRRELDRESGAVLRRAGRLELDLTDQTLRVGGETVEVSPTEFRLLAMLAAEPGRVFSRRELMSGVSRRAGAWRDRTCDAHVKNLRRKIEQDPGCPERLVTVRGRGYALHEV